MKFNDSAINVLKKILSPPFFLEIQGRDFRPDMFFRVLSVGVHTHVSCIRKGWGNQIY